MRRVHFGQTPQTPKTWKIDDWSSMNQQQRMAFLRHVSSTAGQDPRIATLAVNIFRSSGVKPRDYKNQAKALLSWVQNNIYYVNEPNERLQDPTYTLNVGYGDCDDMSLLLGALCESVKLEYRYVLAGRMKNGKIDRWIEGEPMKNGTWSHIYLIIGYPPFKPQKWVYAEPTIQSAKLGWDIVQAKNGSAVSLPELGDTGVETQTQKTLVSQLKDGLHPTRLIPTVIVAGITSVLVAEFASYFRTKLREIRKRNK